MDINFKKWFNSQKVNWTVPDINKEMSEFKRTAKTLKIKLNKLLISASKGRLTYLDKHLWKSLENTDSWLTTDIEKVRSLAKQYDRDVGSIEQGGTLPAPIVLNTGRRLYLIGGNTRLMVARAMGVIPKVFMVSI